jgi:hypothetical protein|tara:strand:+ start:268 stop:516 length:249 start_codon:yes stop_codon:yes gene_type:complete
MLEVVLAVVAALVTWYAKRRIKRLEDDNAEYLDALSEIDLAVATGNQERINARLESTLRRLRHDAKSAGDTGRQASGTSAGG